jgi:natural product precursor
MNTKKFIFQSVKRVNSFTVQDLAIDLIELSEKDLQNISGGHNGCGCGGTTTTTTTTTSSGGTTTTTTTTTTNHLTQTASALRIDSISSDFISSEILRV